MIPDGDRRHFTQSGGVVDEPAVLAEAHGHVEAELVHRPGLFDQQARAQGPARGALQEGVALDEGLKGVALGGGQADVIVKVCLLYTSDAADE